MLPIKLYAHGELCLELTETKHCQLELLLGTFVALALWLIQAES